MEIVLRKEGQGVRLRPEKFVIRSQVSESYVEGAECQVQTVVTAFTCSFCKRK